MRFGPGIEGESGANYVLRLRLDREHDTSLIGKRSAEDDEAPVHELVQLAICVELGRSQSVRANGNWPRNASIATQFWLEYRYANWFLSFSR